MLASCGGDEVSIHLVRAGALDPRLFLAARANCHRTEVTTSPTEPAVPGSAVLTAARTGETVLVVDGRRAADRLTAPNELAVPLLVGDHVVGVLSLARRSPEDVGPTTAVVLSLIGVLVSDPLGRHVEQGAPLAQPQRLRPLP